METTQIMIWAATVAGLIGLALAFYKSERLAIRLGALGVFGAFYLAVLLWGPTDDTTWFNITTASVLLIAFGSRLVKPSGTAGEQKKEDG
jgi:hypothetical protein